MSERSWVRVGLLALGLLAGASIQAHAQQGATPRATPRPAAEEPGGSAAAQPARAAPPARSVRRSRARARRSSRGVLIHEGRAMQSFSGGPGGSSAYAQALNAIHRAVGDRATVYSIIVPTAQEFYLPEPAHGDERANILGTYSLLADGIRPVDAHAELAAHADENLYFRTDTHWTGLAGYYAYRAFCRAAGVDPVPLERMERRVLNHAWLGSLYRITRDSSLRADEVEILVPPAQAELRIPGGDADRTMPLFRERSPGYSVFLGGDRPITVGTTSTRNGRRAILVKNSYGNAFGVHLVSHYEEVVYIDYRTFRGSLLEVLGESQMPTDLLFMNGSLTSNSSRHTAMLLALLEDGG